ncbi:hypothetical protein [Bradyrhizobium liaoningense]|uniref:hypothetical protein n=1 Tax=Bradyrhizobium liaoningense TaxID=43992 RepID=UPI001BADEAD9|nr:hypothetical protein [Bradyrhizobium liaoningense]MBR0714030.1 hypothetical protein [Bradyrhizobium liaoningense]
MRRFSVLAIIALGLAPVSAHAADCRVTGHPSAFGVDMMAFSLSGPAKHAISRSGFQE